ncbi:siphovirus ReqiPepy6 Gp37-like family protein [Lachnospiraceae bacterium 54-11]
MEIYILDKEMNILGIIGVYEAIIWDTKYNEPGVFKIELLFDKEVNEWLQRGNLIFKTDEVEAGVITRRHLKVNKYGEEIVVVSGCMMSGYLKRRIIWDKMILAGKPELVMRELVYQQCIGCSEERKIPRLELGELKEYDGESIEKQITYDNLQESLTELSNTSELGYRILMDLKDKTLYFDVYRGEDRTYGTADACVFNRDYGNILEQSYEENEDNYRNVCLVAGSGEDADRIRAVVGDASGIERYEMYCNAAHFSDREISAGEYINQLKTKGQEKLSEFCIAQAFTSKASSNAEGGLGDYVTCTDSKWGVTINTQIKEIEKGYSKKEFSKIITFGDAQPTLTQLIKRNSKG